MAKILKPEKIDIKNHPEITEKMIQEKIAEDPAIIGLGDLVLKDKERVQPGHTNYTKLYIFSTVVP